MNVKAERIEQMIQLVNRNLVMIVGGQKEGLTSMETRKLQKVDTVIFGHDKFAFEMVHFITSAAPKVEGDKTMFGLWENAFLTGLENLLVECAVISDEIERDCFISRVYCWFSDKLTERRDIPRSTQVGLGQLVSSIVALSKDAKHTLQGLQDFDPNQSVDHRNKLMEDGQAAPQTAFDTMDRELPPIQVPAQKSKFGSRKVPMYVKHAYPTVFAPKQESYNSFLPKIPGADENYGLIYNKPETEAERNMNELWLARRKQEAFDYKTQQQLAIVIDRLALHKSRMESDSLRRQESDAALKTGGSAVRPLSADDAARAQSADGEFRPSSTFGSFADRLRSTRLPDTSPLVSPQRRRKLVTRGNSDSESESDVSSAAHTVRGSARFDGGKSGKAATDKNGKKIVGHVDRTTVVLSGNGVEKDNSIPNANRTVVFRDGSTKNFAPMRFKIDVPPGYANKSQYYMQLSDSDDEDKPDRIPTLKPHSMTGKGGKKKPSNAKPEIFFKRDHPVIRERPVSAKLFRQIAANDSEFKVHFRHTNFRRMPMTEEQQRWLEERDIERTKKSEEMARQLAQAAQEKADKKKAKDAGKDKKDKKGGDAKKDSKGKRPTSATLGAEEKPKPKYKSAAQFMSVHFPKFEDDENLETMGPMRTMQLMEVGEIMDKFERREVSIKETVLRKALVIPQDKPDAICLENLREEKEGLMINPNPIELWRKFSLGKKGKKGGKKKKKKA